MQRQYELAQRRILRAQLYVQSNLHRDLSLRRLAASTNMSPSHFHRAFTAMVGETPKQYVDRLRVEKSVYDLMLTTQTLTQVAYRFGFNSQETYTRVFKRVLGVPPSQFIRRFDEHPTDKEKRVPIHTGLRGRADTSFNVTRLAELNLVSVRHTGPYDDVPLVNSEHPGPWQELESFVESNQLAHAPFIFIGVPYDNPSVTPRQQLRYDCCIKIDRTSPTDGRIASTSIQSGYYGVLTHAGPYRSLSDSYQALFTQAASLKDFVISPKPIFEHLIGIAAKTSNELTWTDLYIPLEKRSMAS